MLRDALISALKQDFDDFEVVVSDNFNDQNTQVVFDEFEGEKRLRCIRTDSVLNMPDHWEFATLHARGQYVLILTNRSVLKQGALKTIHAAIISSDDSVDVCSWRWSGYDAEEGREVGDNSIYQNGEFIKLHSAGIIDEFASGKGFLYTLPRGLNCCYRSSLVKSIRLEFGSPFNGISPDYFLAFVLLGLVQNVMFIDKPLFISQGYGISNGLRGYKGTDTGYLSALGKSDLLPHVPLKLPLVENCIFEDFLFARELVGGNLKDSNLNWNAYFEICYRELEAKKSAGIMPEKEITYYFDEWQRVKSAFDLRILNDMGKTIKARKNGVDTDNNPSWLKFLLTRIWCRAKRFFGSMKHTKAGNEQIDTKPYATVLELAGF